jgi:hypothetical protein
MRLDAFRKELPEVFDGDLNAPHPRLAATVLKVVPLASRRVPGCG